MAAHAVSADFEEYWLEFLTAWKGCYQKVQQAAKDTPQELQWFGAVNSERKKDPLLRYLFEARNDEEHGIVDSLIAQPAMAMFRAIKDFAKAHLVLKDGVIHDIVDDHGERVAEFSHQEPHSAELKPVKDRAGRAVPAPTSHLGNAIEANPHVAADLGLQWLDRLVAVAEAMRTP